MRANVIVIAVLALSACNREPAVAPRAPMVAARLPIGRVHNAQEYFSTLERRFHPDASKDVHAVIQFELSGPEGGSYSVGIDDGAMKLKKGSAPKPDVTIAASAEDYVKVVNGEMGGVGAVLGGKMKVGGNLTLARRLNDIFPPADKQ